MKNQKEITVEVSVGLGHGDDLTYCIEAEVTLPCYWWELGQKVQVKRAEVHNWISGSGYGTAVDFDTIPAQHRERLIIDAASKARLLHPHLNVVA